MYLGNDYFFAALGGSHEIVYQNITLSGKETAEEFEHTCSYKCFLKDKSVHQNSIVPVQFEGKKLISEILIRGVLIVVIYAFSLTVFTLWSSAR